MAADEFLFPHLRLSYHLVVIYGNFVILVVLLAVCSCCFKRKTASSPSEEDVTDSEGDSYKTHFGSDGSSSRLLRPASESFLKPFSPTHEQDTYNLQPPPLNHSRSSPDILSVFQKTDIQPTYEDLLSFDSSLTLPQVIPEAPTGLSEELGTIYFSVSYDVFELMLKVLIHKAVNLPAKDLFGTSDPYVKVSLQPGQSEQKLHTRIRMKNLNPVWNEVLAFEGFPHDKLVQKSLHIKIFDYDRFSRDDALGETELALGNISLQKDPVEFVKDLRPCKHSRGYLGDLLLSLCYNPTLGRMTIIVMKCSRLRSTDVNGKSDPYIKLYLQYAGRKMETRRSQVQKKSLNPVWNEVFEFEIPFDKLRGTSLVFSVKDYDVLMPNKLVGKVVIGQRSAGTSLKHWTDMLNSPRKAIAMWHTIIK